MLVKNKKTNIEYELTKELWDKIVDRGLRNLYIVTDPEDKEIPKIKLPKEIIEFKAKNLKIEAETKSDSERKSKKK